MGAEESFERRGPRRSPFLAVGGAVFPRQAPDARASGTQELRKHRPCMRPCPLGALVWEAGWWFRRLYHSLGQAQEERWARPEPRAGRPGSGGVLLGHCGRWTLAGALRAVTCMPGPGCTAAPCSEPVLGGPRSKILPGVLPAPPARPWGSSR